MGVSSWLRPEPRPPPEPRTPPVKPAWVSASARALTTGSLCRGGSARELAGALLPAVAAVSALPFARAVRGSRVEAAGLGLPVGVELGVGRLGRTGWAAERPRVQRRRSVAIVGSCCRPVVALLSSLLSSLFRPCCRPCCRLIVLSCQNWTRSACGETGRRPLCGWIAVCCEIVDEVLTCGAQDVGRRRPGRLGMCGGHGQVWRSWSRPLVGALFRIVGSMGSTRCRFPARVSSRW